MPDHSSDATTVVRGGEPPRPVDEPAPETDAPAGETDATPGARRTRSRQRRTDWRLGGRTTRRWREWLLAVALVSLGIGVIAGTAVTWLWQSPWAPVLATALLWVGMLVPIIWAFTRSIPVGMLRFRPLDLLYAVGLALLLRLTQGWLDTATGGMGALPSYPRVNGALPDGWIFTEVIGVIGIAPVIEEFFFRAVILIALYTVLRRPFGQAAAGLAAVIVSSGLFVVVHGLAGSLGVDQLLALTLLGLVCGLLVMLTGRIWAAVLVHVLFNASYVALALAGTYLG